MKQLHDTWSNRRLAVAVTGMVLCYLALSGTELPGYHYFTVAEWVMLILGGSMITVAGLELDKKLGRLIGRYDRLMESEKPKLVIKIKR